MMLLPFGSSLYFIEQIKRCLCVETVLQFPCFSTRFAEFLKKYQKYENFIALDGNSCWFSTPRTHNNRRKVGYGRNWNKQSFSLTNCKVLYKYTFKLFLLILWIFFVAGKFWNGFSPEGSHVTRSWKVLMHFLLQHGNAWKTYKLETFWSENPLESCFLLLILIFRIQTRTQGFEWNSNKNLSALTAKKNGNLVIKIDRHLNKDERAFGSIQLFRGKLLRQSWVLSRTFVGFDLFINKTPRSKEFSWRHSREQTNICIVRILSRNVFRFKMFAINQINYIHYEEYCWNWKLEGAEKKNVWKNFS